MIDLAHIHPMLVHFPLTLLPVALASQAIALFVAGISVFALLLTTAWFGAFVVQDAQGAA